MSKQTDKNSHYVNNEEFFQHMKEHIEAVKKAKKEKKPIPKVSDYIGECITAIASKLANRPNFMNYPFRDEMVSDGIENCLQYLNNFNPDKSKNPFAYFTQIIYFAFVRRIQREKKHLYTKYRIIEESLMGDTTESDFLQPQKYGSDYADQNMHEFVENFERGRSKKKASTTSKNKKKKHVDFDDIFTESTDKQ